MKILKIQLLVNLSKVCRIYSESVQLIHATLSVHLALCGDIVKLFRADRFPRVGGECRVMLNITIYVLYNSSF